MICGKCKEDVGTGAPAIMHVKNCHNVVCHTCGGSGLYIMGPFVNGQPAMVKKCNCCEGKGHQTPEDLKRDRYYHDHVQTIHE